MLKPTTCLALTLMMALTLLLVDQGHALCCPGDVKGLLPPYVLCLDGSRHSIGHCCGTGSCNYLCCNCKGSRCLGTKRRKRSVAELMDDYRFTVEKFRAQDRNGDGLIDTKELEVHLGFAMNETEWLGLDLDRDGFISPVEFDRDLYGINLDDQF